MGNNKSNNAKDALKIAKGIALVTQISISLLMPVFLSIYCSRYLIQRYNFSKFINIIAIILGLLIGLSSVYSLVYKNFFYKKEDKQWVIQI